MTVHILPAFSSCRAHDDDTQAPPLTLTISGKAVHDPAALLAMLHGRVDPGAVRAATCSVCLETGFVASALRPACGDCQCVQRVCAPCLAAWRDGRNGVAALRCPFCRWRWDGDGVAG